MELRDPVCMAERRPECSIISVHYCQARETIITLFLWGPCSIKVCMEAVTVFASSGHVIHAPQTGNGGG